MVHLRPCLILPSVISGARRYPGDAGWSSPVARWAHNPEVAGSNPAPATDEAGAAEGGARLISIALAADDSGMSSLAPVELPDDIQRRLNVYKAVGALLLIVVWGWFALVKNDQTPIFVYLNIAVHEIGHVLFRPFGELTMLIMGSGFEVLFPFAVGVVFLIRKRDLVSTAVAWGWAASALASAATYIADADDGRLALLGATGPDAAGDWERILGEEFFDKVYLADSIAGTVRTFGYALWFVALGLAILASVRNRLQARTADPTHRPTAKPSSPLPALDADQMWR